MVRSKLDDAETQLVNFATKSTILEGFLKANKVPFETADLEEELKLPDIAEKAETFTVLVGCWEETRFTAQITALEKENTQLKTIMAEQMDALLARVAMLEGVQVAAN